MTTSNQITLDTQIFVDFLNTAAYYKPSNSSINAVIAYAAEEKVQSFEDIITDITLYSDYIISNIKGTVNITTSSNNNESKIYRKMISMNCGESIIEILVHTECYPFAATDFYLIFLLFSRNTFASFTTTQRITCYTYIHSQFDDIDDIVDDIDEYDENDNNSAIIEELKMSISDSNEFVSEFKRAIKISIESPDLLISNDINNPSETVNNENNSAMKGTQATVAVKEESKEYVYNQDECKEIVIEIIKLSTDLDILFFDDNASNITALISKLNPHSFLEYHAVVTRNIMKEYMKYPERQCSAIISKQMCMFIIETYFMNDKAVNYDNVNIGKLMRRFIPHSPLLHILVNNKSELCHKLNAKISNIKMIQYLQLITLLNGIPSMMKLLTQQEGSKVIHLDLSVVFNKKIWNGIEKRVIKKGKHNNFIVKSKKRKKKQQYYDTEGLFSHCFNELLQTLSKLLQDSTFSCNHIKIYVNSTKYTDNKWPELMVQFKNIDIVCKYELDLYHAIISRREYTFDIEEAKTFLGYKFGGNGNNNIIKTVESGYMMHSFIIYPRKKEFIVSHYLQYGFGVIRFMKEDIYDIMPHFFMDGHKQQCMTYNEMATYDKHRQSYLRNDLYVAIDEKFRKFRKQKPCKYSKQ